MHIYICLLLLYDTYNMYLFDMIMIEENMDLLLNIDEKSVIP